MTSKSADLMVNDMASKKASLRTLARAALAAAALLAVVAARPAWAAITQQANWTQEYGNTNYPNGNVDAAYAVAAGSGRLLVVSVASTRTSAGSINCSATYGGTALTLAVGDGTSTATWNHSFLFYMKDDPVLMNGTGRALTVSCSGGTAYYTYVHSAVFAGVDQTTPLTDFENYNSNTANGTVGPFAAALNIGANDQAIEIVNLARSTSQTAASSISTWATGWPATPTVAPGPITTSGPTLRAYIQNRTVPTTATTDTSQHTATPTSTWDSMTAMTMKAASVIIGNGSAEPANSSVVAGQAAALDAFSLATSSGTATVTAIGVTLAISAGSPLSNVFISDSPTCTGGTTWGTLAAPANGVNTVNLTPSGYSATTATGATNLYVCATGASVAASATVTGNVSSATAAGYAFTDNDTTGATLTVNPTPVVTIGNGSAEPASSAVGYGAAGALDAFTLQASAGTAALASVTVALTNPAALSSVFVSSSSTCTGGTTYGTLASPGASADIPVSGLSATTAVSANLYVCATGGAVATATAVTGNVSAVAATGYTFTDGDTSTATLTVNATPVTTIGDGTNPASTALLCPSGTATMLDAFTLSATVTADVVNRLTVQLTPAGAWVNVGLVEITNAAGSTVYGSAVPGGDQVNVWVGNLAVPVGPATTYMVRITPRTYAAMPPPNQGQQFVTGGTVVAASSTNARAYADAASATVTIDNAPPADVTLTAPTSGATNIQLNWTAATNVVVLRKAGGPITDVPADGTTAGTAVGSSTVACVGNFALCNSTGLTAGVAYYFEVFTYDSCTNYSLGAPIGPLYAGGVSEGNPTGGTLVPVVGILNPKGGATVTNVGSTGFRVQVRAFSRRNGANAQPLTAVRLKAASATDTFSATCDATNYKIALTLNANYPNSTAAGTDNHGTYEATVTTAQLGVSGGAFTLRACAVNASGTVLSGSVGVTVNDGSAGSPRGDGNLLVRDNGGQLCGDCHQVATHSSEATGNKYGSWYTGCRDCHTPHSTTNIYLVNNTITPPAVNGVQGPKAVKFSTTTGDSNSTGVASASYANSDNSGPCQVCHTRTANPSYAAARWRNTGNADTHYTAAVGTQACTDCHSHVNGFGAAESTGGTKCSGCHKSAWNAVTGTTPGIVSKHTLANVIGVNDTPTDSGITWASPLNGNAPAARSCVNMCHDDHVHNAPAGTTHDSDTYANATTTANRSMTRGTGGVVTAGTPARTDFDSATNLGTCVSCHQYPVESGTGATHPAISGANFNASAHEFPSNVVGATNYLWTYGLHDGSTYIRNCTKCHASRTEGNTPAASGTGLTAVHGTPDPSLLAGSTNPAGTAAGFICYNCHGTTAAPAAGAQGNRSGKVIQAQIAKTSNHPASADNAHNSVTEFTNAAFGNALGAPGRHSSCMDCHDPHEAKAGTHAVTTNVAGPPLEGAWGAQLASNVLFWTAPVATQFTKKVIVAGTDLEATLCFKCHSSYYGTLPTSPSGGYTETDTAREFNPNNVGNYAGTWANSETAGGFHPVLASSANNLGAINMTNLVATNIAWRTTGARNLMTCTDCHESETAADPNGPHGSTAGFVLKGPNTTWSQAVVLGSTIPAGTFCLNCHSNNFTGSRYPDHSRSDHYIACWNCHARVPHGGPRPGMLVAGAGASTNVGGVIAGWDQTAPYWSGTASNRLYIVSYPTNNTTNWQQGNCGCNGTGH